MFLKAANRWQAFGFHLFISAALFVVLAAIIYFWWYPGILFQNDGGLEGIKLVASVDFFIGPLLTLFVYKLGKKSLPFDLAFIAVLQAFCLAGGMWTVWQTRPVAVVYAMGAFRSIPYQSFKDYGIDPHDVPALQGKWPAWVAVEMPVEKWAKFKQGSAAISGIIDQKVFFEAAYYVPLSQVVSSLDAAGKSPEAIIGFPALREGEQRASGEHIKYFPAGFGVGAGYMAVDTATGAAQGFVVLIPREKSLLDRLRQAEVLLVKFFDRFRQ
ncbi:MAG TPA: hypothetical protein PK031_04935 [Pseudomonadales bacterium]|nr:hypothetical protein [Pseudomonadales bacterium]